MAYQISPGVVSREFDLTTVIPAVSTTEAGSVGQFVWGPVGERVLIESENELVAVFGRPTNTNFEDFFTSANFLAYGSQLWQVRVVDQTSAKNATVANASGFLVRNDDHYFNNFNNGELQATHGTGAWVAKFPGALGNSLKVSVCSTANAFTSNVTGTITVTAGNTTVTGANTNFTSEITVGDFIVVNNESHQVLSVQNATSLTLRTPHVGGASANTAVRRWEYFLNVDRAPGTSAFVANAGGSGDEVHVVVADVLGRWTGVPGTVLEVFQLMSKASTAKTDDGSSNYYVNVINDRSKFLRWGGHLNTMTNAGTTAFGTVFGGSAQPTTATLQGGADGNAVAAADRVLGWDLFRNQDEVDVSILLGGPATQTVAVHMINNVAEFRQDCIAVFSPPRATVVNNAGGEAVAVSNYRNTLPSTSWAVLDSGWKYQYDKYNDVYRYVPLNGDVGGLMVFTDVERDPWWSPAGFNRGKIKNVVKLAYNPSKTDRDLLYKNGVNPVITAYNEGTVLFGDKTLLNRPSAFDRINVRRLFIVLRKAISRAAKYMLFEFNDAFTRRSFINMVEPFLRDIQGRRGIFDFRVVCDDTNNTGEVIDRNEFVGDLYVKPARSINYISLNFVAVRTGVDFSEIVGKF